MVLKEHQLVEATVVSSIDRFDTYRGFGAFYTIYTCMINAESRFNGAYDIE